MSVFVYCRLAKDKEVLDCYSYSGGFTLAAAGAGAKSVTAVDSSQVALQLLASNVELNRKYIDASKSSPCEINIVKADAVEYMKQLVGEGKSYDVVLCDPPKLAPTRASLEKARNKYVKINSLGLSLVKSGQICFMVYIIWLLQLNLFILEHTYKYIYSSYQGGKL